jgi:hypothetical protein
LKEIDIDADLTSLVEKEFAGLHSGGGHSSIKGGQSAAGNSVALTFAPVPSFARFKNLAELYPFPWLRAPHPKSIRSFSAWRGKLA